jgi:excinuclease ABC subunit B
MLPRQAQKSGTGQSLLLAGKAKPEDMTVYPIVDNHYMTAADVEKEYQAQRQYESQNVDALIAKAREDMERAAKSLDFLAAARYRDRMYELQKIKEEAAK